MSGKSKYLLAMVGAFALAVIVGAPFVPVSSAAPSGAPALLQHKPAGLTAHTIVNARRAGMPSALVTMAPQSSLKLLSQATEVGPHAADSTIKMTVALKLRNVAQLKQFLQEVQYPASPEYHQWLTPQEFTAQYGPTKADVAQVVAFLEAHHIKVLNVSPNRTLIHTEATTATYEHAFFVRINNYQLNGRSFYSTTDSPKLPRVIAPLVTNVIGLNQGVQMRPHHVKIPLASLENLGPHQAPPPSLTDQSPLQIAHAYNYPDIKDAKYGQGVSVAILTAETPGLTGLLSNARHFWAAYGLPDHAINVIPIDGSGPSGGLGETLLDIEYSGAMGPGDTLNVYVAANPGNQAFTDMYNQFVVDNTSDAMTTSWGAPEDAADVTQDQIFMEAAAQGIAMFAAAGDNGSSDGTGQPNAADYPSVSEYITSANATQLNIANLQGAYGSEVVADNPGCVVTGGAISQLFARPSWQFGPGVPASSSVPFRMNSGIALTGSCSKPLIVYENGWTGIAGTSAVAPQLAGLFAIATAEHGGRLGQSNPLIYTDARNNYATDFHDVTSGTNGAYNATVDWDHPTGWGSVNATNFLSHLATPVPHGMLSGTVTAAAGGSAIAGAEVVVTGSGNSKFQTLTANEGTYVRVLPVGSYTVTVTAFGYKKATASISIVKGQTDTKNFALNLQPTATISGAVTDASGHGYGLYADIKVSTTGVTGRQVADVWTDPTTGKYSVKLPEGYQYAINAAAAVDGYTQASVAMTVTAAAALNFPLKVTAACTAPGYQFLGFSQDFNGATFPPQGWTVVPAPGTAPNTATWLLSSQVPAPTGGNFTGGTGTAAEANDYFSGFVYSGYDTSLITPPIPVTSLHGVTKLTYKANFQPISPTGQAFDLDISTDGGTTWQPLLSWTKPEGALLSPPGFDASSDLAGILPSSGTFQLRWHFHSTTGYAYYAEIDDVSIGVCKPLPGSLVTGQVTDANTGKGLVGARVSDDLGQGTTTIVNLADPNLPVGTYLFFASQGNRTLTATKGEYSPATVKVSVPKNKIVSQNIALKAARFTAKPDSITANVMVNSSATVAFAISNTGTAKGQFKVLTFNHPLPSAGLAMNAGSRVPLRTVKGHFSPASLMSLAHSGYRVVGARSGVNPVLPLGMGLLPSAGPSSGSEWTAIAPYPIPVEDNCVVTNPATGKVYGFTGVSNGFFTASDYAYDPATGKWSPIADFPGGGLDKPACAAINGNVYITAGYGPSPNATYVYDVAKNSFSTAAPFPGSATAYAAAGVALNGKFYVIGGCDSNCTTFSSAAYVYDPASNKWSTIAKYPIGVAWQGCGAVGDEIVCAGGSVSGGSDTTAGFKYDPATNTWSSIAPLPYDNWGMAATGTAWGQLLLQDGVTNGGYVITNQGAVYDLASDTWSPLPNNIVLAYRTAGSCGFYMVGGVRGPGGTGDIPSSEVLPGYACVSTIPWLTVAPAQGTVAAGASTRVLLTFDGSGHTKFTSSQAYLKVFGGVGPAVNVPITVNWDPQPVDLDVSGSVSPTGVVKAGDNLAYTITVQNLPDTKDQATQVNLTYEIPKGVDYLASNGATCTPPSASGSGHAAGIPVVPISASVVGPASVTCDFGTLNPNQGKLVTIAVRATAAASSISGTFKASSREPDSDSSNNTLTLSTNPAVGPTGPTGPQGPKGPKGGSGGLAFGGIALLSLLALSVATVETRKRREKRQKD